MALIQCPECGQDVSDAAATCPGCAYPIASGSVGHDQQRRTSRDDDVRTQVGNAIGGMGFAIGVVVWMFSTFWTGMAVAAVGMCIGFAIAYARPSSP